MGQCKPSKQAQQDGGSTFSLHVAALQEQQQEEQSGGTGGTDFFDGKEQLRSVGSQVYVVRHPTNAADEPAFRGKGKGQGDTDAATEAALEGNLYAVDQELRSDRTGDGVQAELSYGQPKLTVSRPETEENVYGQPNSTFDSAGIVPKENVVPSGSSTRNAQSSSNAEEENVYGRPNSTFDAKAVESEEKRERRQEAERRAQLGWEIDSDRITLVREIGRGNFGQVHEGVLKGKDGEKDQAVAVKLLNFESEADEAAFRSEVKILRMLATKPDGRVVQFLGACTQTQPSRVVMELLSNGDLKTFLRENMPSADKASVLTVRRFVMMAIDITQGMLQLAECNIVHRDMAARNCLVSSNMTVKIADMGLSRDLYLREYYRISGAPPLPIRWLSVEAIQDGVFSSASDVWATGITFWELFTFGRLPYYPWKNQQVVSSVEDGTRLPCPAICPVQLYELMHEMWWEDPDERIHFSNALSRLQLILPTTSSEPIIKHEKMFKQVKIKKLELDYACPVPVGTTMYKRASSNVEIGEDHTYIPLNAIPTTIHEYEPMGGLYSPATAPEILDDGSLRAQAEEVTETSDTDTDDPQQDQGLYLALSTEDYMSLAAEANEEESETDDKVEDLPAHEDTDYLDVEVCRKVSWHCQAGEDLEQATQRVKQAETAQARGMVTSWLRKMLDQELPAATLEEDLKDGVLLCKLVQKLKPDETSKIPSKNPRTAFQKMENIGHFIDGAAALGVQSFELFCTADLFDGKNFNQVVICLEALKKATSDSQAGQPQRI